MSARHALIALSLSAGLLLPTAAPAEDATAKNRIVFQVSEGESRTWNSLLGSLHNIQQALGTANVKLAVVAIGPGIGMITADSVTANRVQDAIKEGVEFVACQNTMKVQGLQRDDMVNGIGYAQAGFVELMRRQQGGWTYLKP